MLDELVEFLVRKLGIDGEIVPGRRRVLQYLLALPVAASIPTLAPVSEAEAHVNSNEHRLEAQIERYIKGLRRKGIIAHDERTAWSCFDFTTGKKLVDINEDTPMQAASLIKPFVALAFFQRVKDKKLKYGPRSSRYMEAMLYFSSNFATNWVMKHVGGPTGTQRILQQHYGEIFRQTSIVEYIPRGGKTYRNKASAHDYSRFLYALYYNKFTHSGDIKGFMRSSSSRVYGHGLIKTGSTSRLCGVMSILYANGHPYTFIGIIEKDRRTHDYYSWINSCKQVIKGVSKLAHTEMQNRYKTS